MCTYHRTRPRPTCCDTSGVRAMIAATAVDTHGTLLEAVTDRHDLLGQATYRRQRILPGRRQRAQVAVESRSLK